MARNTMSVPRTSTGIADNTRRTTKRSMSDCLSPAVAGAMPRPQPQRYWWAWPYGSGLLPRVHVDERALRVVDELVDGTLHTVRPCHHHRRECVQRDQEVVVRQD